MSDVERQLRRELERALVARVRTLVGPPAADELRARVRSETPALAGRLQGGNRARAARAAGTVLDTLWPGQYPPVEWWSSPLGWVVARVYRPEEPVTLAVEDAGVLLDCPDEEVHALIAGGDLDADSDSGEPMLGSVLAYLTETSPEPAWPWWYRGWQLAARAGHWVSEWFYRGWHVPAGGTHTPRRFGVAAIVLWLIPPAVPMLLVGAWLGIFVTWATLGVGAGLGAKGTRRARAAGQSAFLPRLGWVLDTFGLVTAVVGFMVGLVTGFFEGLHELFDFSHFV